MTRKETGEQIGTSGLQPLEDTGAIEVGYNLSERYWRQGYGYECATAWLKYGFETGGLDRIVAVADPANVGSWRIMEKCGMTYKCNETHYGIECVVYAMTREEYLAQQG
jgi:ribosomal-protein-alanine N-acetyltransferase